MTYLPIFGMEPLPVYELGVFVVGSHPPGTQEGSYNVEDVSTSDTFFVPSWGPTEAPVFLFACLQEPGTRPVTGYRLTCRAGMTTLDRMDDGHATLLAEAAVPAFALLAGDGRVRARNAEGAIVCSADDTTYAGGHVGYGSVGAGEGANVTVRGPRPPVDVVVREPHRGTDAVVVLPE